MVKNRVLLFFLFMALMTPVMGYAADELFDTKAAAERMERGIADLQKKDFNAAIKEFEEAASISPEAEAYYYLGYAYYLKGRAGDSVSRSLSRENFEKAYEIDPNFTPARNQFAKPEPMAEQPRTDEGIAAAPTVQQPQVVPPAAEPETPQPTSPPEQTRP